YTSNFDLRMIFHENSEARKFTSKADDWTVFLRIDCKTKEQGLRIEKHIKRMKSSVYISNLKKYPEILYFFLYSNSLTQHLFNIPTNSLCQLVGWQIVVVNSKRILNFFGQNFHAHQDVKHIS
ncbi:MAG: GIY-YIG nuclease family protein, partial [Bacteroidetes bacterium]|nr:GIY-YIG nuclease family protein [Bacteroidota bacterium]